MVIDYIHTYWSTRVLEYVTYIHTYIHTYPGVNLNENKTKDKRHRNSK